MGDMTKRIICVAIGENSTTKSIQEALKVQEIADVIEIRIDYIDCPDIAKICTKIDKPLLFTNRPDWEGGLYKKGEDERVILLQQAVLSHAAYIDLELKSPQKSKDTLLKSTSSATTKLILSSHNFECTPKLEVLVEVVQQMKKDGADIGKLITTAKSEADALNVLQLQQEAKRIDLPLIAFCMGEKGAVTRVSTCDLGGYMTYCSTQCGGGTAPGQIDVVKMNEIFKRF